ncbi:MAG: response regulator transcription factor [Pseudomonadota bacterium]
MATLPILAVGADPAWLARMRRLFSLRAELSWLGSHACSVPHPASREQPALLLLDGDDVRTTREPRRANLPVPARLYFFRHPDAAALQACLRTGARGCLDKQLAADAVLRAVAAAGSGLFVMAPALLVQIMRDAHGGNGGHGRNGGHGGHGPRWYGLTERQRQIVDCVAAGLSNKEIARQLQISSETVKTHLKHVFEHEGVHGRTALLAAVRRP